MAADEAVYGNYTANRHKPLGQEFGSPKDERVVFFRTLLGDGLGDGLVGHMWHLASAHTDWVQTDAEAEQSATRNGKHDVYMGVGLAARRGGANERVKMAEAAGLLGLPADIDIAGTGHAQLALPPDEDAALALLNAVALPPTVVVHSGHGIQAWWLFEEPWRFDDDDDRERATALGYAWQAYIRALAAERGWKLDNVGDLSRVLRVPGTENAKNRKAIVPVRLLRVAPEHRYTADQLEAACASCAGHGEIDRQTGNGTVNASVDRYHRTTPCPICGGYQELPQGRGERCWGFRSSDGAVAYCTREERAGQLEPQTLSIGGVVYAHRLFGPCGCRAMHDVRLKLPADWQPEVQSAADLLAKTLDPPRWVVDGLIAEGLNVVAGKAKKGKSVLCVNLALDVPDGKKALGAFATTRTDVLYLALEDNDRRMQKRLRQMVGENGTAPDGLKLAYWWPMLDEGGLDALERWLDAHPSVGLVFIDTLTRIRRKRRVGESSYQDDYLALQDMHGLANRRRLAIVVVVHTRKMASDDPLDELNATMGMGASADNIVLLRLVGGVYQLDRVGRDFEDDTPLGVSRDAACLRWYYEQGADAMRQSKQRQAIISGLQKAGPDDPLSPKDLAGVLEVSEGSVRYLLGQMTKDGEVVRVGRGRYVVGKMSVGPNDPIVLTKDSETPAATGIKHVRGVVRREESPNEHPAADSVVRSAAGPNDGPNEAQPRQEGDLRSFVRVVREVREVRTDREFVEGGRR